MLIAVRAGCGAGRSLGIDPHHAKAFLPHRSFTYSGEKPNQFRGLHMTVRAIIAPGIIFAAGSMAGAANAATTIDTDYRPSFGGTPIILAGGVGPMSAPQFTFDLESEKDVFAVSINATGADQTAGIFYQGSSETLADPEDPLFVNRSVKTAVTGGAGLGDGNYALRFTATDTLYTGFATVVDDGTQIDSITFEAVSVPAVPEPSTWAMMILGLGLAGSELRRRRRQSRTLALAA